MSYNKPSLNMGTQRGKEIPVLMTEDEERFYSTGINLAAEVERFLGVKLATMVNPKDLASVAACVYAPTEPIKPCMSPQQHAEWVAKQYSPKFYEVMHTTPGDLAKRYPSLIGVDENGRGDYSRGEVADALRGASTLFPLDKVEILERKLGQLFGMMLKIDQAMVKSDPGFRLRLTPPLQLIADGRPFVSITHPTIVAEYGPGLVAFRKLPVEIAQTPINILIENNRFTNEALVTGAALYGLRIRHSEVVSAQVIGREDGIKSATAELLGIGLASEVDIILASKIQTAGLEEITAGIVNAHILLKRGGLLAFQEVETAEKSEVSGRQMLDLAKQVFGKSPDYRRDITLTNAKTGKRKDAFAAVFIK